MQINYINKYARIIGLIIAKVLGVALPVGDELASNNRRYEIIPLKGQSSRRSFFETDLRSAQDAGSWIPKILLLPDVGKFEIQLQAYNAALLANGIVSRYPSEIKLYKNRNRKMNRYLIYCYWRLFQKKGNATVYWSIATNLIRNSSTYLAVCMHSVDRNIYRKLTQKDLKRLIMRLNEMRANYFISKVLGADVSPEHVMRHYIKFCRVWIPKGENSHRPLGVPSRAWRVFQKMWLIPVMGITAHNIPEDFHGFIPRRGTGTAWKSLIHKVVPAQNIFEFDFKGFFPSIPTDELSSMMCVSGDITRSVGKYLHHMNNCVPMFLDTEEERPVETTFHNGHLESLVFDQIKLALHRKAPKPITRERVLPDISTITDRIGSKILKKGNLLDRPYDVTVHRLVRGYPLNEVDKETLLDYKDVYDPILPNTEYEFYPHQHRFDPKLEIYRAQLALGLPVYKYPEQEELLMIRDYVRSIEVPQTPHQHQIRPYLNLANPGGIGLPQGAPLSPYLSILYFAYVITKYIGIPKGIALLMYADDGMFYSDDNSLLNKYLERLRGPASDPNSLAFYGIRFAEPKCKWAKVNGEWVSPYLKFLGLKLIPGRTHSDFKLIAETRPRLLLTEHGWEKKSSNLEFTKHDLVAYSYFKTLLRKGEGYLTYKLNNAKLGMIKAFYRSAIGMAHISDYTLDYLYLIAVVVSKGVYSMMIFLLSDGYLLRNYASMVALIQSFESEAEGIHLIESRHFDDADKDKIFATAKWVKGGYNNTWLAPTPTEKLLEVLETSVLAHEWSDKLVVHPTKEINQSLLNIMMAPLYFGMSVVDAIRKIPLISRQTSNSIYSHGGKPLDMFRFLMTLTAKAFAPLVPVFDKAVGVLASEELDTIQALRRIYNVNYRFWMSHWMTNLVDSRYFGLIMSRLYTGSYLPDRVEQSFEFTFAPLSLAEYLNDHAEGSLSVFVGSSYAFHEVVRLTSHFKRSSRNKVPFVLFKEGLLTSDAWESGTDLNLQAPSLASEFPGGQEPSWD